MINLEKMAEKYRDAGYSERNADARVCQDIVLKAIARSNLGKNVTIKGGVVMRSITGNVEHSGDRNWLQIDVGVAFKMIQDFLETVNL